MQPILSAAVLEIDSQQFGQGVVGGDVGGPAVGGGDGLVERGLGVAEPLGTGVAEVGQRAGFEGLCGLFVAGDGAHGIAGHGFIDPRHPFGRIEPAVAQFDESQSRLPQLGKRYLRQELILICSHMCRSYDDFLNRSFQESLLLSCEVLISSCGFPSVIAAFVCRQLSKLFENLHINEALRGSIVAVPIPFFKHR